MAPFEIPYLIEDFLGTGILSLLLSGIPSGMFGIATYVLTSLALYTAARRRGLNHPWLAWIPVANCWIIGSLSDQYRYVVKGQIRSKRKVLLVLNILSATIGAAALGVGIFAAVDILGSTMRGALGYEEMMDMILGPAVGIVGLCLPLAGVTIANVVIRYMALYDIYRSMDPANCVLFTVLSILFNVTEPFFLFFNRNKDLGMPPRREETVSREPEFIPAQPVQEFWETEEKDYL